MRDNSTIMRDVQVEIRRQIDLRHIPLKVVASKSGIPYPTLLSYFPGGERLPAELPVGALYGLAQALPIDLLSLLLPDGYAIVKVPVGFDHDELASGFEDYLAAKTRAHHPESECGRDIGPNEHSELTNKVVHLPIVRGAA